VRLRQSRSFISVNIVQHMHARNWRIGARSGVPQIKDNRTQRLRPHCTVCIPPSAPNKPQHSTPPTSPWVIVPVRQGLGCSWFCWQWWLSP
jgi:hypothetical protein